MTRFASGSLATAVLILAATVASGQEATAAAVPANPYTPPACVPGVPFSDITCTTGFDAWIERFAADGITAGCGGGKYCPGDPVTRSQMAVFIEKAMRGTSAWSPGDSGNYNTFLGASAGLSTSGGGGFANTATGYQSLYYNAAGYDNTAAGYYSLYANVGGASNVAAGYMAGYSNSSGSGNTFLGASADAASGGLTDATAIGFAAVVSASYHVRIGDTNITQIGGQVAWSNLSDIRAKTNIQKLDLGLDFVMALRPMSFTLKQGNGRTDMGFIAQDLETLLGDDYNVLGIGADKDRSLSLRYTDLIAPMVKAIQEQQSTIQAQQAQIDALKAALAERDGALERRLATLEQKKQ